NILEVFHVAGAVALAYFLRACNITAYSLTKFVDSICSSYVEGEEVRVRMRGGMQALCQRHDLYHVIFILHCVTRGLRT
ncbi:MAG: hypothetical protein ACJASZ_001693, partial [Yoonia sp.]